MIAKLNYRADLAAAREEANHARRLDWIRASRDAAEAEQSLADILRFDALLEVENTRHETKLRRLRAAAG